MKTIIRTFAVALLATFTLSLSASELLNSNLIEVEPSMVLEEWMLEETNFETVEEAGTVVDIAISNPDFSILVEAVSKAGLVEALSAEGPFTVFAPTNDAFSSLFTKLGVKGVSDLTVEQLMPILTYHVVSGKVKSTDLSNGMVSTLNESNKLKVDLSNGVKINSSNVIAADIHGKNGVIHVIDAVLLPR